MRKKLTLLAVVAALVAAVPVFVGDGVAAAATAPGDATVTFVQGLPASPVVDVYIGGTEVLAGLTFGTVSAPLSVAPGTYSVAIKAGSYTLVSATETFAADENATITANLDTTGGSDLNFFQNPTAPVAAGDASVLVRHAANVGDVDVYLGSDQVVSGLANATSAGPLTVPAGAVQVSVTTSPSTSPSPALIGPVSLTLDPGDVYIVYAIGDSTTSPSTLTAVVQHYTVGQTRVGGGYRLASANGQVACFGGEQCLGNLTGLHLNAPVVGIASTADGRGYWLVASDGGVFSFGDATFHGSAGNIHLNAPVVGIVPTADDAGYWLVASDGGVFSFGDAHFYGSTGSLHLNAPVAGIATTTTGDGYWLVARDGGVFSFGNAIFHGSLGGRHLNAPVVGITSTPDGGGYTLVASDGGVFTFGDATFHGSTGSLHLNAPVVGITSTPDGGGYSLGAADGGVFSFGNSTFYGSSGGQHQSSAVVGIAS